MGKTAKLLAQARKEGWAKWIKSPADERAVAEGYRFDPRVAERVRYFFHRFLPNSKEQWAGQPFELLPWQWQEVIAPLFGWLRPDGTRRYRHGYITTPKKAG